MKELKILYAFAVLLIAAAVYLVADIQITGQVVADPFDGFVPTGFIQSDDITVLDNVDVICSGLLYSNLPKGTKCENDILVNEGQIGKYNCATESCIKEGYVCAVPGLCSYSLSHSVAVVFDIPKFIGKGETVEGKITFVNTGKPGIEENLNWNKDRIEVSGLPDKVSLKPNERKEFRLTITGTEATGSYTGFDLDKALISTDIGDENHVQWLGFVYDGKAQECGGYYWNFECVCDNGVFYPQGDCLLGKNCANHINRDYPERDVIAFGDRKVTIATVSLKDENRQQESYYLDMGKGVSKWYDREAMRLLGKDVMNLEFEFGSHLNIFYLNDEDLKNKLEDMFPESDFIVAVLDNLPDNQHGFTGGMYFFDGFIQMNAGNMDDVGLSHEIAHGFGARDLYEYQHLTNSRWNQNLMAAGSWISGDLLGIQQIYNLNNRVLGDAAWEIGWMDYDGDGIVDVVDKNIEERIPDWMSSIDIEILETVKDEERKIEVKNYNYYIYPDDAVVIGRIKAGDVALVANVSSVFGGKETQCETGNGKFYCFLRQSSGSVRLKAVFGSLEDVVELDI